MSESKTQTLDQMFERFQQVLHEPYKDSFERVLLLMADPAFIEKYLFYFENGMVLMLTKVEYKGSIHAKVTLAPWDKQRMLEEADKPGFDPQVWLDEVLTKLNPGGVIEQSRTKDELFQILMTIPEIPNDIVTLHG